MPIDNIQGLRAFLKVVETGNFSEAGRALGMVPSSVSRQIGHLEDELDVQLFNRTTRRINLTEAGRLYYDRVSRILKDLEETNRMVTHQDHTPAGLLRINAPIGFGNMHITPVVNAFLEQYPEVDIELSFSDHLVDVIAEGLDLVIRVGALRDSSLIASKLAGNRRVLCAAPKYLKRSGKPADLDDLRDHSCLVHHFAGRPSEWHVAELLPGGEHGPERVIPVGGRLKVNNTQGLYEATLAGIGLSVLPTWVVGEDIKAGRLIQLFERYEFSPTDIETAIYALYPPTRHLSAKVRTFLDFLKQKIGPVPYWERDVSYMYM